MTKINSNSPPIISCLNQESKLSHLQKSSLIIASVLGLASSGMAIFICFSAISLPPIAAGAASLAALGLLGFCIYAVVCHLKRCEVGGEEKKQITPKKLPKENYKLDGEANQLFKEEDIIEIHQIAKTTTENNQSISWTAEGKAILKQVTHGDNNLVTALEMLARDHNRTKSKEQTNESNNYQSQYSKLQMKFFSIYGEDPEGLTTDELETLKEAVNYNGSVIVMLFVSGIGHAVLVDKINLQDQSVRLRDPFRGLEITVKADAFKAYLKLNRDKHSNVFTFRKKNGPES